MAIPFLSDIKLNGNQIKELVVDHKSGSNPSSAYHGQLIFRTDEDKIYVNTSTTYGSPSWTSIAGDIIGIDITAGNGLTGTVTTTAGTHTQTLDVVGGDGITANADEIEVTVDNSTIALSATDGTGAVKIKDGGVDTTQLKDDAVTGAKIAADTIDSEHYKDGSIDHVHLAADAVDGDNIADNSINSEHYVDGSIDTDHIADDQVTFAKIQNISSNKILGRTTAMNGSIEEISPSGHRLFLKEALGGAFNSNALTIGTTNDTITIPGNLTVTGDTTYSNETIQIVDDNKLAFRAGDSDTAELILTANDVSSDITITLPAIEGKVGVFETSNALITATPAEINKIDGFTGDHNDLNYAKDLRATGVTATEFDYLDDVSSNIQTQLDGKQATITGAATTIDDTDLTASRALISNGSGKVAVSAVTSTELGYLDGVTSGIQTQLNNAESSTNKVTKKISGTGSATVFDVDHGLGSNHVKVTVLDYGNDGTLASYQQVMVDVKRTSMNNSSNNKVQVTFGSAPSASQDYLVLVEKFPAIS